MEKEFIITNKNGLHARPATSLVSIASKFESNITLTFEKTSVDLKSIMSVLILGLKQGSVVTITVKGIDEEEAIKKITEKIVLINLG